MNEETLHTIRLGLAALAKLTADVTADIARELETLKQPKAAMTRAQAIEEAATELDKLHESSYRIIANDGAVWRAEFFCKGSHTTAVMRDTFNSLVVAVGRSRCARDDVYHSDIGKLIAFYRATGSEVPGWLLHVPQK